MKLLKHIFLTRGYLFMLLGGFIFVTVLYNTYRPLDQGLFDYRDDGVITVSHAKNLVDHGFIGVNPSGERVEGFSAPVQFWTYTLFYGLFGTHFMGFADAQTWICTFLLGFFFVGIFHKKYLLGAVMSLPVAAFISMHASFYEWHASGMENAMTHVFLMGSIYLLTRFIREGEIKMGWAVFFALAALSRLEGIYHVGALLIMFAIFYKVERRSWRGMRLLGLTIGLWSIYHLWRFWYFGSLEPNTGVAQNISVGENLASMWKRLDYHMSTSFQHAREIMSTHGAWWLVLLIPLYPLVNWKPQTKWIFFIGMTLVITAFLNPFFFGKTRLDPTRSTTFLTPILGLILAQVLLSIPLFKKVWLTLPLAIVSGFSIYMITPAALIEPHYICCGILRYEKVADTARKFDAENNLHRINLSTPDLGKISYLKEFNITDLGLLGSPLMAELFRDKDLIQEYYLEYAAPDVIQVHQGFARDFGRMLTSSHFKEVYKPQPAERTEWLNGHAPQYPTLTEGYFVRRDLLASSRSPEWQLIQDMKANLSPVRIQEELARSVDPKRPEAHQYVVRTVYRFMPEIRDAGQWREFYDLFAETPSAQYDQAILSSHRSRRWKEKAEEWLREHIGKKVQQRNERVAGSGAKLVHRDCRYRVYLNEENTLTFAWLNPNHADSTARCHFHVHIPDSAGVPRNPRLLDFTLDTNRLYHDGDEMFYQVPIPMELKPTRVKFGQHWPGHLIWEGDHNF